MSPEVLQREDGIQACVGERAVAGRKWTTALVLSDSGQQGMLAGISQERDAGRQLSAGTLPLWCCYWTLRFRGPSYPGRICTGDLPESLSLLTSTREATSNSA